MKEYIEEVELLATRESNYTIYVFKIVSSNIFVMCTRLPNWNTPNIEIGEIGFLQYEEVKAGEEYYHPASKEKKVYEYSNVYFKNFVKKSEIVNSKLIL